MAKSKTDELEQLRAAHASEIQQLKKQHAEEVLALNHVVTQLKNEIAAGKPEELATLRKLHDADVEQISALRRQIRESEKK